MTRRSSNSEQEFGSDSFLDIIANIVGILIILIVVAGVKVSRQAAMPPEPPQVTEVTEEPLPPLMIPAAPEPETEQPFGIWEDPFTDPPEPTEDFDAEISTLRLQLDQAQETFAESSEELQRMLEQIVRQPNEDQQLAMVQRREQMTDSVFRLRESLSETNAQLATHQSTLNSLSSRQSYVAEALEQVAFETRKLRETLNTFDEQQKSAERINHRLSPVGETVTDQEVHFRLAGGRIAHIPLEGLLDRLKNQVGNRRGVVMKFHRYEGLVGPVGGFRMNYVVTRVASSPVQSLQYGRSVYRMAVARWTIVPAETLQAEPIEQAMKVGSRFRQIMEATDPDTTVTIWLYPDDFDKFTLIRELAHNLNLRVAARPLPEGTPIQGSPNGSRSTSQ